MKKEKEIKVSETPTRKSFGKHCFAEQLRLKPI